MPNAAMSVLEATPVGEALCLLRQDTGALGLLNATARHAWEASPGELPTAIDDAMPWLLRPVTSRRAELQRLPPNGPPILDICICSPAGRTIRLRCHEPWLADQLRAVLAPLPGSGEAAQVVDVGQGDRGTFCLWRDGVAIRHHIPRAEIRRRVLGEVACLMAGTLQVAALLHASAIGFGDGAVVLAGRSGAGKSTLTAALVAAGGGYLGDDLIPLDRDGLCVHAFASALSVKTGSWPQVGTWFPALDQQPVHAFHDRQLRYLPLRPAVGPLPVRVLVFPSFEPGAVLAVQPVAPEQAFALLLDAGTELVGDPTSAKPLALLADSVAGIHMTYGDLDQAVDTVRAFGGRP